MTHRNLRGDEIWCDNVAHSPRGKRPQRQDVVARATVAANRRTTVRLKALFSLFILGVAGSALAQAPAGSVVVMEEKKTDTVVVEPVRLVETPKPAFVFEMHGFVSGTLWLQDARYNNNQGQIALFAVEQYKTDKITLGGDVRQTRLNFSLAGPEVFGGAKPKAIVEVDFFGSEEFTTVGARADVSIVPRMRVAVAEIKKGGTTFQIGVQNMLTVGTIPQSLSHIAFPYTYGAGTVGWRQPGIWAWHMLGDSFEFAWSVARAGWNTTGITNGFSYGVASGLPAFEARLRLIPSKSFDMWLTGHWQTADRNGPGVEQNKTTKTQIDTIVGVFGFKAAMGFLNLAGSAWYGKNAAPLLGNILQWPNAPGPNATDVFGYGAWAQAGFNFSKIISLWFTYGLDHPLYSNAIQAGFVNLRNQNFVTMFRIADGGFAYGVEYLYTRTTTSGPADVLKAQQLSLTANYSF
jgi:hypothetical protein